MRTCLSTSILGAYNRPGPIEGPTAIIAITIHHVQDVSYLRHTQWRVYLGGRAPNTL